MKSTGMPSKNICVSDDAESKGMVCIILNFLVL